MKDPGGMRAELGCWLDSTAAEREDRPAQPALKSLRAAVQETVAAASEDGLQLVRDMQAHPEVRVLLGRTQICYVQ